ILYSYYFFFSSRRRHTRSKRDWSSDVCSSDLMATAAQIEETNINKLLSNHEGPVKVGHPSGIIEADTKVVHKNEEYTVERAAIGRTARRIMEGSVIVENHFYSNIR